MLRGIPENVDLVVAAAHVSFGFRLTHDNPTPYVGARSSGGPGSAISLRILAKRILSAAISAIWKETWRSWPMTLMPVFIGFCFRLVSDQLMMSLGFASVRG